MRHADASELMISLGNAIRTFMIRSGLIGTAVIAMAWAYMLSGLVNLINVTVCAERGRGRCRGICWSALLATCFGGGQWVPSFGSAANVQH